jgi:hypothetical protein
VKLILLASGIDPSQDPRHPHCAGERAGGIEQRAEPIGDTQTGAHRAEFDEETIGAGLARRSPMADREAAELARTLRQQQDVAEAARGDGADLSGEIEAVDDLVTAGRKPRRWTRKPFSWDSETGSGTTRGYFSDLDVKRMA